MGEKKEMIMRQYTLIEQQNTVLTLILGVAMTGRGRDVDYATLNVICAQVYTSLHFRN